MIEINETKTHLIQESLKLNYGNNSNLQKKTLRALSRINPMYFLEKGFTNAVKLLYLSFLNPEQTIREFTSLTQTLINSFSSIDEGLINMLNEAEPQSQKNNDNSHTPELL